MWQEDFLLWYNLICVLYASCMFIGISFYRLENFSFVVLLKIFSGPKSWDTLPSFIPTILKLSLFIASQISWKFCIFFFFLDLTFSLVDILIYSVVFSMPERVSLSFLVFCWWCLCMLFLFSLIDFSIFRIPSVCVFFIASIFIFMAWTVLNPKYYGD